MNHHRTAIAPRMDARDAYPPYADNQQILADEDRLANLVNIPPFEGQQAVQLAVATAVARSTRIRSCG